MQKSYRQNRYPVVKPQKKRDIQYTYSPCLGLPLFRALGTFADALRAEVRAPPASIASSHHPAHLVSDWRVAASRGSRDERGSDFSLLFSAPFPHPVD